MQNKQIETMTTLLINTMKDAPLEFTQSILSPDITMIAGAILIILFVVGMIKTNRYE